MTDNNSNNVALQQDSANVKHQDNGMVLARRVSDQNIFYTYMCQLNKIPPKDIKKLVSNCYSTPSRELIEQVGEVLCYIFILRNNEKILPAN